MTSLLEFVEKNYRSVFGCTLNEKGTDRGVGRGALDTGNEIKDRKNVLLHNRLSGPSNCDWETSFGKGVTKLPIDSRLLFGFC